jgi:NAD+ kinase
VTAPDSVVTIVVDPQAPPALLSCDGRRVFEIPSGATITVSRGELPVRVVRLRERPFTDRLVAKFGLPVAGWRSNSLG